MKKVFFAVAICIMLCGCSHNNGYQFSDIKAEQLEFMFNRDSDSFKITGRIKNISNTSCNEYILVKLQLSDGDIKEEQKIMIPNPQKNETNNFYDTISTKLRNFKITVKSVSCSI